MRAEYTVFLEISRPVFTELKQQLGFLSISGAFLASPARAKSRGKSDVLRVRKVIRSVGGNRGLNPKQLANWLCFGTSPNGIPTSGTVR